VNPCTDCGEESHIYRDDAYWNESKGPFGPDMGAWYCDPCYASNYFPDKLIVDACRLGVTGEIIFVPDDAQCVNCDSYLLVPGARVSKAWELALADEEKLQEQLKGV
jgi:hypothetical protein